MTSIPLGVSLCTEISKYGWPPKSEKVPLMYTNVHICICLVWSHMYIVHLILPTLQVDSRRARSPQKYRLPDSLIEI